MKLLQGFPLTLALVSACLFHSGCNREEEKGDAPPSPKPLSPGVCADVAASPVAGLPGRVGDFCVDPRSDVRRYGAFAAAPLDSVCVELFNGECELYKSFGLEAVKTLHYVTERSNSVTINVVVSSFRRSSGAFGFFTRRILGDGLPSAATVVPLEVSGRAVSGVGTVVVWRGKDVVELTYVSEEETPTEIEERSPKVLHPLARAVSEGLVGPVAPERAVLFLESLNPDALGVAAIVEGLMGVSGTGPGSMGYFSKAEHPHRIILAPRRDDDGAEDLLRLLRRSGPSKKLKGRDVIELRRTREGAPPETWYLRRNQDVVIAIGPLDDPTAAPAATTPKTRKGEQAEWKDFALRRLMAVSGKELEFQPGD